jgi:hypothetical protein
MLEIQKLGDSATRRPVTVCLALACMAIVFTMVATTNARAGLLLSEGDFNVDLKNQNAQTANDLHMYCYDINKEDVGDYYVDDYGSAADKNDGANLVIDWSCGSTTNGNFSHFGFTYTSAWSGSYKYYWTLNGDKIGDWWPGSTTTGWLTAGLNNVVATTTNVSTSAVWVQRRVLTAPSILLSDLCSNTALWNGATLIDTEPIQLTPNMTTEHSFSWQPLSPVSVMMYSVYANNGGVPGELTSTVYCAVTAVPEPSTLVLLGVGAVSVLAYGWRRRKRTP